MTTPTLTPRRTLRKRLLGTRENWAKLRVRSIARNRDAPPPFPDTHPPGATLSYVVLSKDRPMQLDACLRSIRRFAPQESPPKVLFKASTKDYAAGYELLAIDTDAQLLAETGDFRRDVLNVLDDCGTHTAFLMDDDVFFRSPPASILTPEGFAAVSLRLGLNTTHCYALDRAQPVPLYLQKAPFIAWNWTQARDDFAYPMSIDGSVFRTELLRRMLRRASFLNPSELEEELHLRRHLAPHWLLAFQNSCLVSIPANVVTATHRNRAGSDPSLSPHRLNTRFLAGERIDLNAIDFGLVRSAHHQTYLAFQTESAAR